MEMHQARTILITRQQVASILGYDECIKSVEEAFRSQAEGKAVKPQILGVPATDGGFHIKAAIMNLPEPYFVAKTNANFPLNRKRFGLPTIQGIIVVSDAGNGRLLALIDSIEISIIRTGAATAIAAKHLSRPGSKTVTICGCGNQGRISLKMLRKIRPIEKVFAFDIDKMQAQNFVEEFSKESGLTVMTVDNLRNALKQSDICVTCTPSKEFFIAAEDILPGIFIAGVGADNEDKQELDPVLLSSNKLVVDSLDQCGKIGELHHSIEKGLMRREDVYAEIGEIIAGQKPGRLSDKEIIIFDSTGIALQDVAAAAIVYQKAIQLNIGTKFDFGN